MPVKNDREYRNMTMEIRAQGDGDESRKIVRGYATTFGTPYLLYKFRGWEYWEVIDVGAFDNTDMSDVIMQYDHQGRVFARTRNNTLTVGVDQTGLLIEADLGGTDIGRELYEEIAGGYTDRMSFGFTVNGEFEERHENEDGVEIYTRHITSVKKLYDVSAVSFPANDNTSIEADASRRGVDNLTNGAIERIQAERLERKELELRRKKLLTRLKWEV